MNRVFLQKADFSLSTDPVGRLSFEESCRLYRSLGLEPTTVVTLRSGFVITSTREEAERLRGAR